MAPSYDLDDHAGDWDEPEDPIDDDGADCVACPECGAQVYEDAEQCVACGEYIVSDSSTWGSQSPWMSKAITIVVILLVISLLAPALLSLISILVSTR